MEIQKRKKKHFIACAKMWLHLQESGIDRFITKVKFRLVLKYSLSRIETGQNAKETHKTDADHCISCQSDPSALLAQASLSVFAFQA